MKIYWFLKYTSFVLLMLFAFGCSGKVHTYGKENLNFPVSTNFFIVKNESSTKIPTHILPIIVPGYVVVFIGTGESEKILSHENTALFIQQELKKYGIMAPIGNENEIPTNIDVIIRYKDEWMRAVKLYLQFYEIKFFDRKTGDFLAVAQFMAEDALAYPTTEKETPRLIEALFRSNKNII